jgi:hypothetical protein
MSVETMVVEPESQDQADDLISHLEGLLAGDSGEVARLVDAVDAESASLERDVNALLETAAPLQPLDPIEDHEVTRPPAIDQAAGPAKEQSQAPPAEDAWAPDADVPSAPSEPEQEQAPAPPSIGQLDVMLAQGADAAVEKPEEEAEAEDPEESDEAPEPPPPPAANPPQAQGKSVPKTGSSDRVADEMAMWGTVPSTQPESADRSAGEPPAPATANAPSVDAPSEDSFAGVYLTPDQILSGMRPQPPAVPETSKPKAEVPPTAPGISLLTRAKGWWRLAMTVLRRTAAGLLVVCEFANRPLQDLSANTRAIVGYVGLLTLFNGAVLMVGKAISVYLAN